MTQALLVCVLSQHLVRVLEKTVKFHQTVGSGHCYLPVSWDLSEYCMQADADALIKFIPIRWVKKMLPEAQGKGSRWDPIGSKRCALDFAMSKVSAR